MKRFSVSTFAFLIVIAFSGLSSVDAGYITGGAGLAKPGDYNEKNFGNTRWAFDDGLNLSFAFGGNVKMFRLEGELSYRKLDFESRTFVPTGTQQRLGGDQTQTQLMFNGIYQIKPEWTVSPFIGVGIGFTRVSWNDVNTAIDDSDTVFTYQAILGGSIRVNPNLFIEGKYYYVVPDDVEVTDIYGITGEMDNQELDIITIGIRYNFWCFSHQSMEGPHLLFNEKMGGNSNEKHNYNLANFCYNDFNRLRLNRQKCGETTCSNHREWLQMGCLPKGRI